MAFKAKTLSFGEVFSHEMLSFYYDHPCEFVEDIIFHGEKNEQGLPYELSEQQKQILKKMAEKDYVSVKSGHGIGKTCDEAFATIWFLCTRYQPRVLVTAPTFRQLNDNVWPELSKWLRLSLVKDLFTWTAKKLYLNEDPTFWFATAITASSPESIQGAHRPHLLLILDEASGIDDEIYITLSGSLTESDNKVLLIGNPTQTDGFFFDSHNKMRHKWSTLSFSSIDSPFVKDEWIGEMRERYGENSDIFKVRVLGEFPSGSPDSFIPLSLVERAVMRECEPSLTDIQIGVDVARFGNDKTAICYRMGNVVYPLRIKEMTTIPEVTGLVLALVREIRENCGNKPVIKICVDDTGLGGGVTDELMLDRENNIKVVPVNFGNSSDNPMYEYKASELYAIIKDRLQTIQLPDDPDLVSELSQRKFKITVSGKIRLQPKSEFKKEFGRSPDKADALVLAFATSEAQPVALKDFDFLNTELVKKIDGYKTGDRFCSVFYSKDKKFSVLYGNYCGGKLYVQDEFQTDDYAIRVASDIQQHGKFEKVLGNDLVFGKYGEDIAAQFMKSNLIIFDNYRYDEYGAIDILIGMIKNKRIVIDIRCEKLIMALRKWNFNKNKNDLEVEYSMAYCLLNIISELKDRINPQEQQRFFEPYSNDRTKEIQSIGRIGRNNMSGWQLN